MALVRRLELLVARNRVRPKCHVLGSGIEEGERPQIVVPAKCWQAARSLGAYTLVGCTVAPGFLFETFELAELQAALPAEA